MARARIRSVKPDLFRHEGLFEAEQQVKLPLRLAFIALLTICDKEGRFRWQPRQMKLDMLPYDLVDVGEILNALEKYGFINRYEVVGESYGYIPTWGKHQTVNHREQESVIPSPTQYSLGTPGHTEVDPGTPGGKGNGNGNGKGNGKGEDCAELFGADASAPPAVPPPEPVISLPLNTGTEFPITRDQVAEWSKLYPAIDVMQSLRDARGWCIANPSKRKTKTGILRFVNSWLSRDQNDPRKHRGPNGTHQQPHDGRGGERTFAAVAAESAARLKRWGIDGGTAKDQLGPMAEQGGKQLADGS